MGKRNEDILIEEDILEMLDDLLREPSSFWNNFYSDKVKMLIKNSIAN